MNSRINHSSHLIDFLIPEFEYKKIDIPLKKKIDFELIKYDIPELEN